MKETYFNQSCIRKEVISYKIHTLVPISIKVVSLFPLVVDCEWSDWSDCDPCTNTTRRSILVEGTLRGKCDDKSPKTKDCE